jgi:gliding-associated putative ABC transporter substrate-binding component GldG
LPQTKNRTNNILFYFLKKLQKNKKQKNNLILYLHLTSITIFILIINITSYYFYYRIDFSAEKRYTLSRITKQNLSELKQKIFIDVYYSSNLPPELNTLKRDFIDILKEYENISKGKINFKLINVYEDTIIEKHIYNTGIKPLIITIREQNQIKQQKAYLGAVVHQNDKNITIPFVKSTENMEYQITSAIIKLDLNKKTKIGIIQGHGEPSIADLSQLSSEIGTQYNIVPFYMNDSTPIPLSFASIIILAPFDSINFKQQNIIDNYLSNGGNAFIGINRVYANLNNMKGDELNTGLEHFLQKKGIIVDNKFIIDAHCGNITLNQNENGFKYQTNVQLPYIPLITNFITHPISSGIENIMLDFPSPILIKQKKNIEYINIARTSSQTGIEKPPLLLNFLKEWKETDFPLNELTVAIASIENLPKNKKSKMVIIGDGDFVTNGEQNPVTIQDDNINFVCNSIEWLTDKTGLSALRNKNLINNTLIQLPTKIKEIIKYVNFLLPILLIIAIGIFRFEMNKNKKLKLQL